jgi:hypothetical protein
MAMKGAAFHRQLPMAHEYSSRPMKGPPAKMEYDSSYPAFAAQLEWPMILELKPEQQKVLDQATRSRMSTEDVYSFSAHATHAQRSERNLGLYCG